MAKRIAEGYLLAGYIYGDNRFHEYVYLPGSEIDAKPPMLVYETENERRDISMAEALSLIEKRSLSQTTHPVLGRKTV
ncbi:MAG: hypothetical protein SPI25_06500 [Dialister sp.]|nr:hypothetical protein [Dialister sp.]